MNRDCHGDFFLLNDKRLYACFANSEVVTAEGLNNGDQCPACARQINAPTVAAKATLETAYFVTLGDRRIELAKELLEPPKV